LWAVYNGDLANPSLIADAMEFIRLTGQAELYGDFVS
jgi:hypothetical protein